MRELFWTGHNFLHQVAARFHRAFQILFTQRPPVRAAARAPAADNFLLGKRVVVDRTTGHCTALDLGKAEAEVLLDWLEAEGNRSGEVLLEGGRFAVRWCRGQLTP